MGAREEMAVRVGSDAVEVAVGREQPEGAEEMVEMVLFL
jgi:hypothetical protein